MRLDSVQLKNFRCVTDQTLTVDGVTALVGRNGAGKSTFLQALEVFYTNSAAKLSAEDFYDRCLDEPVEITLTWTGLSDAAKQEFGGYVQGDSLSVLYRIQESTPGKLKGAYHGQSLRHPAFAAIRDTSGANDQKRLYNALREQEGYRSLPAVTKAGDALDALKQWEAANPDQCERRPDDGQFFGFTSVGQWRLSAFTGFTYIPAVRDAASDADTGRTSTLSQLVDQLVRAAIDEDETSRQKREQMGQLAREIYGGESHPKLNAVAERVSSRLQSLVPTAEVNLSWAEDPASKLDPPRAAVRLKEDSFPSPIQGAGHGLQRAYVIALIQEWAAIQREAASGSERSFILAMEEPELYQHPNRQRHLANQFYTLASEQEGGHVQIIYTTHSPLFTRIEHFDGVRRVSKDTASSPPCSMVSSATADSVAQTLAVADGGTETYTGVNLLARLADTMRPFISEGFFADYLVLVEGGSDRAALLGLAGHQGVDLAAHGVSVLSCGGKANMGRCAAIFQALGIPTYAIWDCDKELGNADARAKADEMNGALLLLHQAQVVPFPTLVADNFACYGHDMEKTLKSEMGSRYAEVRNEVAIEMGYPQPAKAKKNPRVVERTLARLSAEDIHSPTLDGIMAKIRVGAGLDS